MPWSLHDPHIEHSTVTCGDHNKTQQTMDTFALTMMEFPLFEVDESISGLEVRDDDEMPQNDKEYLETSKERFARSNARSQESRTLCLKFFQQQRRQDQVRDLATSSDNQGNRGAVASVLLQGLRDPPSSGRCDASTRIDNRDGNQVNMHRQRASLPREDKFSSLHCTAVFKVFPNISIQDRDTFKKDDVSTVKLSTSPKATKDHLLFHKGIAKPFPPLEKMPSPYESDFISRRNLPDPSLLAASGAAILQKGLAPQQSVVRKPDCDSGLTMHTFTGISSSTVDVSVSPSDASAATDSLVGLAPESSNPVQSRKRGINEVDYSALSSSSSTMPTTISPSDSFSEESSRSAPVELPSPSLIHHACKMHSQLRSIVACVLHSDPAGASRRFPRTRANFLKRRKQVEFDFPFNIALQHNAPLPVLQLLAGAGSEILVEGDGPEWCCALSCALYKRRGMDIVSMLVEVHPDQVRVRDRHLNYPLHVACLSGSPLPIIKLLTSSYRRALRKTNFHGQTPLDIAQRSTLCRDEVVDYLQEVAFGSLEEKSKMILDSDNDGINGFEI